ncbi:LSU ribosomal protein L30P [Thermoplasmatales archaeon SCGC AB-539-N05]|nr:LSU ribosomal protein L30P [Thermoplasmatales archaeon SCGC AB-539-N05]ENO11911.1 LSU ribosomal protein L30P [Thermoplasmatales archaeon SCGC AB-539-C06]
MVFAVIRIRGTVNIKTNIKRTLGMLRLTRANHCVLINESNKSFMGMIKKAKDYITWGELDKDLATNLIKSRGKLIGNKDITDEYIKSASPYNNTKEFAYAVAENKMNYSDLSDVKPLFRLNPPKNGYHGIKKTVPKGGALGYRGKNINLLIEKML